MNKWMFIFIMTMVMGSVAHGLSDDFEDGVIDTNLWAIGGAKRGPYTSSPKGVGGWTYSHYEIVDSDGYLKMRVEGPTSGISYGAEAWVRTKHDYNDGQSYLLNFTWEAEVDTRATHYLIQITDGYIPDPGAHWWYQKEIEGTANLLWGTPSQRYLTVPPGTTQTYSWSITINPNGVARLYDDVGGNGALLHENDALDLAKPWHVRFMVACATSAGFPAGDSRLNLYDFSVVSEPPWSFAVSEPVTGAATEAGSGLDETDPAKMVQIRIGDVEIKFVPLVPGGGNITLTETKCESIPGDDALIIPDISGIRAITSLDNGDFVSLLKFFYEEPDLPAGWTERDLAAHKLMVGYWIPLCVAYLMVDMAPYPTYGPPTLDIGDWGVDTDGDYVWANINTFTDYAVGMVSEPSSIEAAIDIDPDTLNLKSKGEWITCYIELPGGYDVGDIDVSTIMLNEQVPAESSPTDIGDYDDDGVPDLMVKFDKSAVQEILEVGNEVEIAVTGDLTDGSPFEGTDTIRVIEKGGKK